MTAQIANGGYKIYPKILADDETKEQPIDKFSPLYNDSKNIKIIQDAMFGSTNEVMGTSYVQELITLNINLLVKLERHK